MLNIARIDDEQESLDIAKGAFSTFCESFHQEVNIKGFTRGDVFLDSLKDNLYDLLRYYQAAKGWHRTCGKTKKNR